MKILFFVRSLELGGSQRQLAVLAAGLAKRGHDISVAVFYAGGPNEEAFAGTSVRVVDLRKSARWDMLGPVIRLWRLIRAERPDILYAFLPAQTSLAAALAPRGGKLIFGIRAAGMQAGRYDLLSGIAYRLELWLSRRADLIIANAEAGRADAIRRGMFTDRIMVIPNGIDAARIRPDPAARKRYRAMWDIAPDSFVIGMVARLDPMKDHPTFLRAADSFRRLHPNCRFVCVGNGPVGYAEQMEGLANSLGLTDMVVWANDISDARAAYNAFDIATLSSAFGEAFPNAVGEAMACGIPVVATDLGDVASIVGRYGEIVPAGQPGRLCAGWVKMRARLEQEPRLGEEARNAIADKYGVEAMVSKSEAAFVSVCSALA